MAVGYVANDSCAKRASSVYLSHFTLHTVKLDFSCSSCNFTERNNLASGDVT